MADPYLASNEFPGDGSQTVYNVSFKGNRPDAGSGVVPYLSASDVKAQVITPATQTTPEVVEDVPCVYIGPNQFSVTPATPVGKITRIYRATEDEYALVDYQGLQTVSEADLDLSNRQVVFIVQETHDLALRAGIDAQNSNTLAYEAITIANQADDKADTAIAASNLANATANQATVTANAAAAAAAQAVTDAAAAQESAAAVEGLADAAVADAAEALATANTALTAANSAVVTANSVDAKATTALTQSGTAQTQATLALSTANGIDAKATQALADSATAITTANAANATATGIAATANTALANSTTALNTANNASTLATAVSNSVAALATNAGDTLVGTVLPNGVDGTVHQYLVELTNRIISEEKKELFVTPEQFGWNSGMSIPAQTAAVQAAFDAANTSKLTVGLQGNTYFVSQIRLVGHTSYNIFGVGSIVGNDTSTNYNSVLEIKNCTGLQSSGSIGISAAGNLNYACGIKVWGSGGTFPNFTTCSLHNFNFSVASARIGWCFGDPSAPDNLLSEQLIQGGYTYDCPQAILVIGTQAVIEANGYQLIAARSSWSAGLQPIIAQVVGGVLTINGGEAQMPGESTGFGFVVQPIDSPNYDRNFGTIETNGCKIECAGVIALCWNPNSVSSPRASSGGVLINGGGGYHSFSGVSFQGDASFTGKMVVTKTAHFTAPAVRTAATATFNAAAEVDIDENALNVNFKRGLHGITGNCVVRFPYQQILEIKNLNGQAIAQSTSGTLKFQSIDSANLKNVRFQGAYNSTTGRFTAPAGGLKDVHVQFFANSNTARPNSEYGFVKNSAVGYGAVNLTGKYVNTCVDIGDMVAGDYFEITVTNLDTGTLTYGPATDARVVISARC